ncbi:nucleotidyltransferase domain-containing protein [Candidatus Woesearchaeota archaeon]|nr:nucleotidyltransferase domain-containing protein [Candidatus Woesearchaeota archaeon]
MNSYLPVIKPTPEEQKRVAAATDSFIQKLSPHLDSATAVLGGSGAKGTWLSGNHDLDIFVLFPLRQYASKSMELSTFLEKSLRRAFPRLKINRINGSRDYFQMEYQGFNLEIVPIFKITTATQAVNITDVSPLHTRWVRKQPQKVKDQILLTKQFCRAAGVYGAESTSMASAATSWKSW